VRLAQTRADVLDLENHRLVNPDQALNQIAVTETQDQSLVRQVQVTLRQRQQAKKLQLKSARHGNVAAPVELKKALS
jgi:alpha-galactosidase